MEFTGENQISAGAMAAGAIASRPSIQRKLPARATQIEEQTFTEEIVDFEPLYDVIVIDNPVNTYEEVIRVVIEAIHCTPERALEIAIEIDHTGASCVATVEHTSAEKIAAIIRRIGIEVRVELA